MNKPKVVTTTTYKGHPVIGAQKNFDYDTQYLDRNQELLEHTTARHNKVLAVRIDLKYPADYHQTSGNGHLSYALRTCTRELSRQGLDPQYVARREQKESEHPHFHIGLLLNGSVKKDYRTVVACMAEHWGNAIGISKEEAEDMVWPRVNDQTAIHHENGIMIRRGESDFAQQYDAVHQQFSYMAKRTPEDTTPSNIKKVFYSQYKRKQSRPRS